MHGIDATEGHVPAMDAPKYRLRVLDPTMARLFRRDDSGAWQDSGTVELDGGAFPDDPDLRSLRHTLSENPDITHALAALGRLAAQPQADTLSQSAVADLKDTMIAAAARAFMDPTDPEDLVELGLGQMSEGHHETAGRAFARALEASDARRAGTWRRRNIHEFMAIAAQRGGDLAAAMRHLDQAAGESTDRPGTLLRLAHIALEAGEDALARQTIARLWDGPGQALPDAHLRTLSRFAARARQSDIAPAAAEALVQRGDPPDQADILALVRVTHQFQDETAAAQAVARYAAQDITDPDLRIWQIRAANVMGDPHRARRLGDAVITDHPDIPEAYVQRGLAALRSDDAEAAAADFAQVTLRDPEFALGHFFLARALDGAGQRAAALQSATKAARLEPQDPRFSDLRDRLDGSPSTGA